MKVRLKNDAGITKEVKVGFSWTTFFWGCIPALIRGDLKWATIMFVLAVVAGIFTFGIGAWIPGIIFSFVYNKLFIKDLLEKGYRPADAESNRELKTVGIISDNNFEQSANA